MFMSSRLDSGRKTAQKPDFRPGGTQNKKQKTTTGPEERLCSIGLHLPRAILEGSPPRPVAGRALNGVKRKGRKRSIGCL